MILNKATAETREYCCHVLYQEFQHTFATKVVDRIWQSITYRVWFSVWNRETQQVRDQIKEVVHDQSIGPFRDQQRHDLSS
jgi:ABC-type cobalamin/Fe3+-siderophores transport system ATPase subunit